MPGEDKLRYIVLFLIALGGIILLLFIGPIEQDQGYHKFADERTILAIPNFWNVLSNIPFLIIGSLGMFFLASKNTGRSIKLWISDLIFFIGIFFTGIGSAYYHWYPNAQSLVWDRLPMTISFMAFFSIVITRFICARWGFRSLLPFLMMGVISVMYWQITKSRGEEDLRVYVLVQFLPVILIPAILLMFKVNKQFKKHFWMILFTYLFAKIFEMHDLFIYRTVHFVSGHSLKHFAAALGPLIYVMIVLKNKPKVVSKEALLFSKGH